ncbi:response regulator [Clostridium swellfunianum]|uniref:response regulator transcription factor n=1 Tax=Clostridium swellfunianum TaxID=1367462 RepID=UPI00202EFD32|nr:response regulator [Clostridium swellfunianum]MCM0648191.1 response regulator [Clostridium swellfunianum]
MLKMLIVEDEDFERTALKFIVNKYFSDRIEVAGEASNGEQAVQSSLSLKPDIILMDINMPIMDGLKASEKIKENNKDAEIIILTAYNYFEYAKRGITIGVFDYLLKPFSDAEFLDSVNRVIKKINERASINTSVEDSSEEKSDLNSSNNMEIVETAKKYIEMNYTKEISLEEIASYVSVSSFYLSRVFSKKVGLTYKDYLIKLRMEKAKQLLREGKKSIKEVSIEVGYSDQNYFSKAFKKYYDKSPKEFSSPKG